MNPRCILWDFGDTLVDQRFLLASPPGIPSWTEVCRGLMGTPLLDRWFLGELTTRDMAAELARRLPLDANQALTHLRARCRRIAVHTRAMGFAEACALPQAIVTVNPDLFTSDVVPALGLDRHFHPIVTSWEERTLDKTELCVAAMRRLGIDDPAAGLLVDNLEPNIRAWREHGGTGYLFLTDERFAADLESGDFPVDPDAAP